MKYQCYHILEKGPNKGQLCNKNAWFPIFYPCFCKNHAEKHCVPITIEQTNTFINYLKLNTTN